MGNNGEICDRILTDAARLFLQYGYKRTTMESIAAAVGFSKASLYLHFENKDAIFHAVGDRMIEQVIGLMRENAARPLPPREKMQKVVLGSLLYLWDFCHQAPHAPDLWAETLMAAGEQADRGYMEGRKILADIIREGQQAGQFSRARDPMEAAELVQLAVRGFEVPYNFVRERREIETQVPMLIDLLLDGLEADAKSVDAAKQLRIDTFAARVPKEQGSESNG